MKLGKLFVALVVGSTLAMTGCNRRAIEAVNLANEADQQKKVDVEGAIGKYETAVQMDPTNHRIMYKLAMAYKKKEVWDKEAATLARATQVAPKYANYWYERGLALVQIADKAKTKAAWEEAKEPLVKCIEVDPNLAQCYHELGTVMLWLDSEQDALENYSKAIAHRPTEASFYGPLADLYIRLDYFSQAEAVLKQGIDFTPDSEKTKFGMYVLLSMVSQARNDLNGMVSALEEGNRIGGNDHPEILYNLGSTYAVLNPPKKSQAIQMLKQFAARACKGGKSEKYKDQCEQSQALIAKLGGVI
jgi:tetratricopeptide (TPR) repeat protein